MIMYIYIYTYVFTSGVPLVYTSSPRNGAKRAAACCTAPRQSERPAWQLRVIKRCRSLSGHHVKYVLTMNMMSMGCAYSDNYVCNIL